MDGRVLQSSFDKEARARVADWRSKVTVGKSPSIDAAYPDAWGSEVSVETTDGRKFSAIRRACKGDPENPVTGAELAVKARLHLIDGGMPGDEADRFIAAVNALTEDRPVAELGLFRRGGEPPVARRRSA
jgi:2-methylcitrate dehydratase PrpD